LGLEFKSEFERNPINSAPSPSPTPSLNHCEAIKEERDLMNEFLEDMGHAVTYDLWKSAREEVEKMKQQYNENGGFEEVQ
jgi:hypothetical protein